MVAPIISGLTPPPATAGPILLGPDQIAVDILRAPPRAQGAGPSLLRGEVRQTRPDGTTQIDTDQGEIIVRLPPQTRAVPGQKVEIALPSSSSDTTVPTTLRATPPPPPTAPAKTTPPVAPPDIARSTPPDSYRSPITDIGTRGIKSPDTSSAPLAAHQDIALTALSSSHMRVLLASTLPLLQRLALFTATTTGMTTTTTILSSSPPARGAVPTLPSTVLPLGPSAPVFQSPQQSIDQILQLLGLATRAAQPTSMPPSSMPSTPPTLPDIFLTPLPSTPLMARIEHVIPPMNGADLPLAPPHMNPTDTSTPYIVLGALSPQKTLVAQIPISSPPAPGTLPAFAMIDTRGAPDIGTLLTLTARPTSTPLPASAPMPTSPWTLPTQHLIADLSDLLSTLPPETWAGLAGTATRAPLPQPTGAQPQQLAPAMLFFIAALRSGDMGTWLGDNAVTTLKRLGKGATLDRLNDTARAINRLAEGATGDYKTYILPMQFEQTIKPIFLHVRQEQSESGPDSQGKNGARFVLQVEFDRLGAVQLDLLYRPQQLDTILRTELPLSRAMGAVLAQKYASAMQNVGHTGELFFQDGFKNWVTVQQIPQPTQVLV